MPDSESKPSPALVAQRAVQRLPRLALVLLCAAWIIPGVFGRDPWRNQDMAAFGVMKALADGRTDWLAPSLGGIAVAAEPLAHWIGALSITALSPFMSAELAARIPFALLLALTLALVWYACFHLARTEAALPVAFAFGGEASAVDYARAIADGSLLAMIASLGLLQLGHETTPELVQLCGMSMAMWALAAAPYRNRRARVGLLLALSMLAASGAPTVAVVTGLAGAVICAHSGYGAARRFVPWCLAASGLAAGVAVALNSWAWRAGFEPGVDQLVQIGRQWLWFLWPSWLFALWTLWQWRRHWLKRHVSIPATFASTAMLTSIWMGGHDRALMLALPGLAVLAAFALPTMRRSVTAAIDWFSVFALSFCGLFIWSMYIAMQLGSPARWLANIQKLQPGFEPVFSGLALLFAATGTLVWLWLVRWRTGKRQHALWTSLVLPASGVALCWLLLMTLWLPLLDYARSPRPLIERGISHIGQADCVLAPGASPALVAALEVFGRYRVDARPESVTAQPSCPALVRFDRISAALPMPGWRLVATERRNREDSELMSIYRRIEGR